MILRIAICDDMKDTCIEIQDMCKKCCKDNNITLHCSLFYSGEEIVDAIKGNAEYDLIFLDIQLANLSGVDVGIIIREQLKDNLVQIVYISTEKNYALDLFPIRPFHFLIKPISYMNIFYIINKYQDLFMHKKDYFEFMSNYTEQKVRIANIIFFERKLHKTVITTTAGFFECSRSINDIAEEPFVIDAFLRTHGSYLINKMHIVAYRPDNLIVTNNINIPISRKYKIEISNTLLTKLDN
ncbi:DNA-binding response regulator [Clostridia bacterium]|nr:DNA-binding response regulator [Clostridia bacterium]